MNLVHRYVYEVLAWDAAVSRVERAARGGGSSLRGVLTCLELGIVGNGNRGTKGVGHAPQPDDATNVSPVATGRYRELRGLALRVTDAIISDGQGEQMVEKQFGPRIHQCTLAQRVALVLETQKTIVTWRVKLASRDSQPALAASELSGSKLLSLGAEAWHASLSACIAQ